MLFLDDIDIKQKESDTYKYIKRTKDNIETEIETRMGTKRSINKNLR